MALLNKYLDDLHDLLSVIKLQIQAIGIYEYKVKKVFLLKVLVPELIPLNLNQLPPIMSGLDFSLIAIYAMR